MIPFYAPWFRSTLEGTIIAAPKWKISTIQIYVLFSLLWYSRLLHLVSDVYWEVKTVLLRFISWCAWKTQWWKVLVCSHTMQILWKHSDSVVSWPILRIKRVQPEIQILPVGTRPDSPIYTTICLQYRFWKCEEFLGFRYSTRYGGCPHSERF